MHIRMLDADDADRVAAFTCVNPPTKGWERPIDEAVRKWIADALRSGAYYTVAGGFTGDELDAIAAWRETELADTWLCVVVAVRVGRQHRGLGVEMKEFVLEQAENAGIRFVVSTVHRDNKAMIALNQRLHARVHLDPDDPRREHYQCIVEL